MINLKFKYKIKETARKHNLPESVVEEIFNSQFKFYRQTVEALPLKTITTEDEFKELKTTFYFKYLGKFFTTWNRLIKLKKANDAFIQKQLENKNNESN